MQLQAAKNSGLREAEWWQLLNTNLSLPTLAKIADVERNWRRYGLNRSVRNHVLDELQASLQIRANAENGATQFYDEREKRRYLHMLDEKDAALLDRYGIDGTPPLPQPGPEPVTTPLPQLGPKPLIVEELPNESPVARAAKNVLKFYAEALVLNKVDRTIDTVERITSRLDAGTVSVGLSGSAACIASISGNAGLVMDTSGDVGIIWAYGVFGGMPSASVSGFVSITSAENIEDLRGLSFETGGSVPIPKLKYGSVGVEAVVFTGPDNKVKAGINLLGGVGVSAKPFETHSGFITSDVKELFNLYEEWAAFCKRFKAW